MKYIFPVAFLVGFGCSSKQPDTGSYPEPLEVVSYPSGRDTVQAALFRQVPGSESKVQRFPTIILVHGDHGSTKEFKHDAWHLALAGYNTLAVDLYRGQVADNVLDAHIMDRGLPDDQVEADLKAAVDYLTGRDDVRRDAIGIFGFDSGGGYALDTAMRDPRIKATVVCYGRLTTDAEMLKSLNGPVLGLFAEKDEGISMKTITAFQTAMQKAGKRVEVTVFAGSDHGFLEPGENHGAKAEEARRRILAFFKQELGGPE
jgi:carboxymethylenebutenolidase